MKTAGKIPREFIDHLLARVDIVDVISARLPLKKAGREYMACCPFHGEKTPSFTVSPSKQFYHCFGCGVHGSAISFLMEYDHLEYVEAIESLARLIGVQVPRESTGDAPKRQTSAVVRDRNLYELLQQAAQWYQNQLSSAHSAMAYLEKRGLSQAIIQRFALGFAPANSSLLREFAAFGQERCIASGMAIRNEAGRVYDRFRERIMFPIRDRRGRVIGFGGRVLGDETPKYLNSPETEVFHKGAELYGLYEARQHTRKLERLLVVEGYMDVIALAQSDITYAVATLGTATTPEHIEKLFRLVPEVVFCFDGDRAGKQAAWRALENTLPALRDDKNVRFLFLPAGEDPDSYVRKIGKSDFEDLLNKALPLTKFFILGLNAQLGFRENYTLNVTEDRARFLKEAASLLAKMPDILQKHQLMPELVRLGYLDASQENLFKHYGQQPTNVNTNGAVNHALPTLSQQAVKRTPMRHAIALLLNFPHLIEYVGNPDQWARYDIPGLDLFLTLLEIIEVNPTIHTAALLEYFRGSSYEAALARLHGLHFDDDVENELIVREFRDCLQQVKRQAQQKQLDQLLQRSQISELNEQERHDLLCLLSELHQPNA